MTTDLTATSPEPPFRILGPLAVTGPDGAIRIPPRRQEVILASLLLAANRVVSTDSLVDLIWDEKPPDTARIQVQICISQLRRSFADAGLDVAIRSRQPGYILEASDTSLDLTIFSRHVGRARVLVKERRLDEAAEVLRAAVGMWRGQCLNGIPSEALQAKALRIDEDRLGAIETYLDLELALGRHHQLVGEIGRLVDEHPLRERVRCQYMLALYRSGRQAEALEVYRRGRDLLINELGLEPGNELRLLETAILSGDPALSINAEPLAPEVSALQQLPYSFEEPRQLPADTAGFAGPQDLIERAPATADQPRQVTPRQLPAPLAHFAGRVTDLAALTGLLDQREVLTPRTLVTLAIGGTAGVGKTALAVSWAHQVAHRFPDGQLYVNLRGFAQSDVPVTSAEAIRGFLDALGVPPERIPPGADAQAALYRSLLADKRMLIVLDNARDEGQARPLLPASQASLVIITSRNQLAGLAATDGARLSSLDLLAHDEAVQLLTARIGASRAAAERGAIEEIAALCAYLPLALAVAAARAATRPSFPLRELATELRDAAGRLDALDAGDPAASVRAVFSWSYQQLSPDASAMFRLLGLHPGPDISVPAAASLAGTDEHQARRLLRELTRDCLITEHASGRYAFHDLLRAYAAEQARAAEDEQTRHAATRRVLDHYLHTACTAANLINPARDPIDIRPLLPDVRPEQLADHQEALAWFAAEHQVLLAAIPLAASTGLDVHAWQIPWTMADHLHTRGHWHEMAAIQGMALAAAERIGDMAGQAASLDLLADACWRLGDYDQVLAHCEASRRLYQQLGNPVGEAKVYKHLAAAADMQGRYDDALSYADQALRLYQAAGHRAGEARMLNNVGWCHALLGDYHLARVYCTKSVVLTAELSARSNDEAHVWDSLGYIEHHLGNLAEAVGCFQRALSIFREFGDRYYEAMILIHLGDTRLAAGELPQAREAWRQALDILDQLDHPEAGHVRAKLGSAEDSSATAG